MNQLPPAQSIAGFFVVLLAAAGIAMVIVGIVWIGVWLLAHLYLLFGK